MAHGSGVISSPTGGAQRGDNGNNATGRRTGAAQRRGEAETACSPARRMRRNKGGATRAAQRGQPDGSSP